MPFKFLIVPQWQGSSSTRALLLQDGAEAIRRDLPISSTQSVEVPVGAGESLGSGIRRFSAIQAIRDRSAEALGTLDGPVIAIGGDCGIETAPIEHANALSGGEMALIWFDAHADLNSPLSSPSGAFHGMALRAIIDGDFGPLGADRPIPAERVILAGTRAFDQPEVEWLEHSGISSLDVEDFSAESLVEAVRGTGCESVYLHIDLDVIDPAAFASVGFPEPFGLDLTVFLDAIRALAANFRIAGAGICEFAPSSEENAANDMATILRIIAALSGPV